MIKISKKRKKNTYKLWPWISLIIISTTSILYLLFHLKIYNLKTNKTKIKNSVSIELVESKKEKDG
ncbi:hypothetical protein KKE45_01125, partial [Patescibacteria group bacterium]|nr:hypothetical protein [Patescibacteria group bacterium]